MHLSDFVMHTEISLLHTFALRVVFAFDCWICANVRWTPAAVQDFSINGSYVSSTSSVVQFSTRPRHNLVAQIYRSPGSDGAERNSRAVIVFFDDVPADMLRMFDAGVPAWAVPQYWQRAAGFDDKFIAHAESKQRVKFMREHVAPKTISGTTSKDNAKIAIFFIILSQGYIISKKCCIKKKKIIFVIDKTLFLYYIIAVI